MYIITYFLSIFLFCNTFILELPTIRLVTFENTISDNRPGAIDACANSVSYIKS